MSGAVPVPWLRQRMRGSSPLSSGAPIRTHPELPTDDTVADLLSNLSRAGVRERVQIVADHFARVSSYDAVSRHLDGRKAGMLFVDVNPGTELAVQTYASLLREDAFIVIDDYVSECAVEKAAQVRAFVDASVEQGYLEPIRVCGGGGRGLGS